MPPLDDTDHVCPLCCEELDISDREFYPCKCGYQVCMWCWHRIRESESGLCPACRTPYGEDPHQFTAVDVEEVLKANKEKEAAAKKERSQGAMEVPKDRTQLANMRVIRRNLVYAVGLPANIANEDTLKRAEYFGQYGKIAKIVINRAQQQGVRASASAYVTFVHKEDTLSCILALDGCYVDNRNIRASYGTSKYCSAFIKNVRCNNPECTYLHEMGAAEDTFTKQEIQAGYVTSGRDVLARQQQIVQEQLRSSGINSGAPRKRIGGGGPSGTGKSATNPMFPPPEFDESSKQQTPVLVPPPPRGPRAVSTGHVPPPRMPTTAAPTCVKSTTAASVVAGLHGTRADEAPIDSHTTLTSLTPLKRVNKPKGKKATPVVPVATSTSSAIGGDVIGPATVEATEPIRTGGLGGDVFTGSLSSNNNTAIGGGSDRWGAVGGAPIGGQVVGGAPIGQSWNGAPQGDIIGGTEIGGGTSNNSTSALASLLGITLPSGSGSLQESSNLWTLPAPAGPAAPSPLASLNDSAFPTQSESINNAGPSLIGGVPIGARPVSNGASNDVALLQSLLPGVHIASGAAQPGSTGQWNLSGNGNGNNSNWSGSAQLSGSAVGPQQKHQGSAGIW